MHMISGLNPGLWYLLPTLHERRRRHPCKARFRLAGCAFAGRVSNPLERDERFQVITILLSRTSPVASWIHAERLVHKLETFTDQLPPSGTIFCAVGGACAATGVGSTSGVTAACITMSSPREAGALS